MRCLTTIIALIGLGADIAGADVFVYARDGSVIEYRDQDFRSRANPDQVLTLGEVLDRGRKYQPLAAEASARYGVPENLIMAIMAVESAFVPDALSEDSAFGLMQLIPGTAQDMGYSWYDMIDPANAIDAGTKLLARHLHAYDGDITIALAAYNAGPGAVQNYSGVPPYEETQDYIASIKAILGPKYDGVLAEATGPAPILIFSQPSSSISDQPAKLPPIILKVDEDTLPLDQ